MDSSSTIYSSSIRQYVLKIKEKLMHPRVFKHGKNIGWMFVAKTLSMLISFATTAYTARYLGPLNFGELSYAISFVGLFSFVASLGIDQILYREFIAYPEKRNTYLGTAIVLRFISAFFAIGLALGGALFLSNQDVSFVLILIISSAYIFAPFQLISAEFLAEAKTKYPSIVTVGVSLALNAFKILIVLLNEGVIFLALVILIEPILYAIGFIYFRIQVYGNMRTLRYDQEIARSMLRDSAPLIFASAFYAIYARIDQVMLKKMIDTKAVGLYDAAVRLSEVSYMIPNILLGALFPSIINSQKQSFALYAKRVKKMFILLFSVSAIIALCTALLSNFIVGLVFGVGFTATVAVLQVYVWSNVGTAINLIAQQILVNENLTRQVSMGILCGMIINVVLNFWLIPLWGMVGAALASVLSYIVPFISFLFIKQSRSVILDIIQEKKNE